MHGVVVCRPVAPRLQEVDGAAQLANPVMFSGILRCFRIMHVANAWCECWRGEKRAGRWR